MSPLDPTHTSDASSAPRPLKPYGAPKLTTLGAIASETAGPKSSGTLDQLFGDDGGFRDAS